MLHAPQPSVYYGLTVGAGADIRRYGDGVCFIHEHAMGTEVKLSEFIIIWRQLNEKKIWYIIFIITNIYTRSKAEQGAEVEVNGYE